MKSQNKFHNINQLSFMNSWEDPNISKYASKDANQWRLNGKDEKAATWLSR